MLFTFPSRYWFTIGLLGVFSLTGWSRLIRAGFLVSRLTQEYATANHASHTGLSPSTAGLSRPFRSQSLSDIAFLQPRCRLNGNGLGSSPVARHYWGNHYLFSLPGGTKMFQFPPFASCILQDVRLVPDGLSHSDIRGSKVICTSPQLFAAYHVLHRLQEPRHPPYALSYFRLLILSCT